MLKRALQLDPNNVEAREALRDLPGGGTIVAVGEGSSVSRDVTMVSSTPFLCPSMFFLVQYCKCSIVMLAKIDIHPSSVVNLAFLVAIALSATGRI